MMNITKTKNGSNLSIGEFWPQSVSVRTEGSEAVIDLDVIYSPIAAAFQIVTVILSGWTFMILACLGYIPGFFFYAQARKEAGVKGIGMSKGELIAAAVICLLGIISIPMTMAGIIPVF